MRKAKKSCKFSGCPGLTEQRYCDKHQKIIQSRYERESNAADVEYKRFLNSALWRHTRKNFIQENHLCSCGRGATQVHHIIDGRDNPALRLEWSNLQALCASCHSRITATNNRKRGKAW